MGVTIRRPSSETLPYYRVHTCVTCADGPTTTPLEYAQHLLRMRLDETESALLHHGEFFSEGWLHGIEGSSEPFMAPVYQSADQSPTQAWLLGYMSARYAGDHDWSTPVCTESDPIDHEWVEQHVPESVDDTEQSVPLDRVVIHGGPTLGDIIARKK